MPLKEVVRPYCSTLDSISQKSGAVNCMARIDDNWMGYNTDAKGALDAIEQHLDTVEGKVVLLVGAGGAGKAIAFEASQVNAVQIIISKIEAP